MPAATTNHRQTGTGDPVNLAVIGQFETILSVFRGPVGRERNHLAGDMLEDGAGVFAWLGLSLLPRQRRICSAGARTLPCQRTWRSINERLHLRLWLTPLRFREMPVWVGQVSRISASASLSRRGT